ncbi:MAG TPA: DUF1573 domain-containing protein [candidate division Zixibacteria bacterium]|nr:DUF1573 domain-containing protein [candidate division Zixibacteria bacterium]
MTGYILYQSIAKRQAHLLFVVLLFALFSASSSPTQNTVAPHAKVKNPLWDFGYLPQKSAVSVDFYIYNIGSAPLTVRKIESGCSCTSISRIEHPLQPGDSAAITVTFKSGRYRGMVKKTTKVYTDDPDNEVLELIITAYILKRDEESKYIRVIPPILNWKLENDRLILQDSTLDILNISPDTVSVNLLSWPGNILPPEELPSRLAPHEKRELKLRLDSKSAVPSKDEIFWIALSFAAEDTIKISVPVKLK